MKRTDGKSDRVCAPPPAGPRPAEEAASPRAVRESPAVLADAKHPGGPGRLATTILLSGILLIGGGLRLAFLDSAPPGWSVDEAANAWNAYCLLKTGMDEHGATWPLLSLRAFGEHRTVWYAYSLLPFQAMGGMNLWTTRLPAALGGVLTLALAYGVGRRMFGRSAGLLAAALLAVSPWHINLCRMGHEASLAPLQVLACLALALWAGFPLTDDEGESPRLHRAVLVGGISGAFCYGYFAVRLFLPLFLGATGLLLALVPRRRKPMERRGAAAAVAAAIAMLLVLAPLAVVHLSDPEMNHRAQWGWAWEPPDPWPMKAGKVLMGYPAPFAPGFLFLEGDDNPDFNPARAGAFLWTMLPLILAGLGWCAARARRSRSCQVLLVWLTIFPVCDVMLSHGPRGSASSVRDSPGVAAFALLGAVGAMATWRWMRKQSRAQALAVAAAFLIATIVLTGLFADGYFRRMPALPKTQGIRHTEVDPVARYVRARLPDVDAVVVRPGYLFLPYIRFVVAMEYDPRQWFAGPRVYGGAPLEALRFGKFFVQRPGDDPDRLLPPDVHRLLVVAYRGMGNDPAWKPVFESDAPKGLPAMCVYEVAAEEFRAPTR